MPKRKSSSQRWLDRHVNDAFVQSARIDGYRSRAAYKLVELQERDRLLKSGMRVVDLGAAPGGWSQVAVPLVGRKGRVVALDLLSFDPIDGVDVIQGDFRDDEVLLRLGEALRDEPLDLVLSDMAPNISGMKAVDQPRSIYLAELALDFARSSLRPCGSLVIKAFHGEGFDALVRTMRHHFDSVVSRKPKASRPQSRETYLVAKGLRVG
ncbi:MAG: 23S rRNA (uridine(2552)-2'-O)-methyltransferase RlmE [Thiohalocapsa sp.]